MVTRASEAPTPHYNFSLGEPIPKRQTISWFSPASHLTLPVTNLSSHQATFYLSGTEKRTRCSFEFEMDDKSVASARQIAFTLQPGQTVDISVRVIPHGRRTLAFGKSAYFCTFTAAINDGPGPSRTVLAQIQHSPLIGPGLMSLLGLVLIFLLGQFIQYLVYQRPVRQYIAQPIETGPRILTRFAPLRRIQSTPTPVPAINAALPQPDPADTVSAEMTYEEIFRQVAETYNLEWQMLAEQAYRESSLDPSAVGQDSEMGMMQIMPATWDEWAPKVGVTDPWDPYSNIMVGAAYLDFLGGYFDDLGYPDDTWMLAAYNWGPHNLRTHLDNGGGWDGIPPLTRRYANRIAVISATGTVRLEVYEKIKRKVIVDESVLEMLVERE